ncbi:MAG: APC family permease [Actinomycetota bacterium]|nr:APC family permease [Actinomycetota bacterium]
MAKSKLSTEDLESRVLGELQAQSGKDSLAVGTLKYLRTLAISVGIQGPTAGVIIGPAIIASIVGDPGSLSQVLALITMSFVAYAFVIFSKSFNTSSSVYAYNAAAIGPRYGFTSAWVLLGVYITFAAGVFASTASIAQTFFASIGVGGYWFIYAIVGAILAIAFSFLSIGISNIVIFISEGISVAIITVVGIIALAKGGYHHHGISFHSFSPSGASFSLLALGIVAAFGQFSGFEGAATLGEEAKDSSKAIPRAIVGSLVASGLIYIFFTWVSYVALASTKALANDPAPLVHIANIYVNTSVGKIVNLAGTISAFGAQLACINAAVRIIFGIAREGKAKSRALSFLSTTTKAKAPKGALILVSVISLAIITAFALEPTANRAAALIIQFGAYLILIAYLMTLIGALVYVAKNRDQKSPIVILGVGVVITLYIIYKTFVPFPTAPFSYIVYIAAAFVALGVAVYSIPVIKESLANSQILRITRERQAA